jgi:hypothetical protein
MKRRILGALLLIMSSFFCAGQEIKPAPEDKAVVYFARVSSMGFAVKFTYFDSATVIGGFNGPKYLRYECAPGKHLFWARSENRDFVEAEVEAGKIYFIEAAPQMGGIKAGVSLQPLDSTDEKTLNKISKLIKKKDSESFTPEELEKETVNFKEVIERGLEKYNQEKGNAKKYNALKRRCTLTLPGLPEIRNKCMPADNYFRFINKPSEHFKP